MDYRRGDVVLVLFPDSNLRTSKRRPALVVQADRLSADLPQTIVAMITTWLAPDSRVTVRAGSESAKGSDLLATYMPTWLFNVVGFRRIYNPLGRAS
jgi:mRNA interferase MazF